MNNKESSPIPEVKIIMGLGNPDKNYENTYHNIGQIFVDGIIKTPWKKVAGKHFFYTIINEHVYIKSALYMNESGKAAIEALAYFKVNPTALIVIHDDSDLPWGTFKLDFNKGSAGHKGVESLITEFGTKSFWRIRLGIREDEDKNKVEINAVFKRKKAINLVLEKLNDKHQIELPKVFDAIKKEFSSIFRSD